MALVAPLALRFSDPVRLSLGLREQSVQRSAEDVSDGNGG